MAYLAVDTSTQTLTIAVGEQRRLYGEASVVVKKNHSNRLMPMIESLLTDLELSPTDLKGIVVGHGPGSYTGVRVGVTTAKMLAWALKIPLVGVSSLNGLAYHYQEFDGLVCPLFDARRQQAYCAVYEQGEGTKGGAWHGLQKVEPDAIRKLESLFPLIEDRLANRRKEGKSEKIMFLGDGSETYRDLLLDRFADIAVFSEVAGRQLVRAAHLLDEGIARIEAGDSDQAESFVPEYLQLVEAEAKLLKKAVPHE